MKNKFNLKLTLTLVSFFISLLFLVLGNQYKVCLFFGFLILGICAVLFSLINSEKVNKILKATQQDIENEVEADEAVIAQVYEEMKKLKKQKIRTTLACYVCAVLLVIVAIFALI